MQHNGRPGMSSSHGKPRWMVDRHQLGTRESRTGFGGVAEGSVVPMKPGNAGGGKRPWFKATLLARHRIATAIVYSVGALSLQLASLWFTT